jgi:hypothetical protein
MVCKDGGVYALKIEDITKLQAIKNNIFTNPVKLKDFNDDLEAIYENLKGSNGLSNPDQIVYEEKFTKYITNYNNKGYDTGVSTYKLITQTIMINGVMKEIQRWNKLTINSNGNIDYLQCN